MYISGAVLMDLVVFPDEAQPSCSGMQRGMELSRDFWESPQDVSQDVPREVPRDVPREVSRDVPRDVPRDAPRQVPREVPRDPLELEESK